MTPANHGGRGSAKSELINNILRAKIMKRMLSGVSQLALMVECA